MDKLLDAVLAAPISNVLILAGILFLLIGVGVQIQGKIDPGPTGRRNAGLIGGALLLIGLVTGLPEKIDKIKDQTVAKGTVLEPSTSIAFVSSRDGNEEIYVMNADGSSLKRLTREDARDDHPSWLPDHRTVAFSSVRRNRQETWTIKADGSKLNLFGIPDMSDPAWSPDGQRVAFTSTKDGNADIYVGNVDGTNVRNITKHPDHDEGATWSRDGTRLAFVRGEGLAKEIWVIRVDGGEAKNITNSPGPDLAPAWSPIDNSIAFVSSRAGNDEIWVMDDNGKSLRNVTNTPATNEYEPSWSPDAKRLALMAEDADRNREIFTMSATGTDRINLTNHPGVDQHPAWYG